MFSCDKCGICCKTVSKAEIYKYLDRGDGICIYFNSSTNLCNIYETRPIICRVDEAYEQLFSETITLDEYHNLNYEACKILKKWGIRMSDIKSALTEKFKEIFGYESGDTYAPRIRNARNLICQGKYSEDELIEIFDTSISSEGKAGLVLTVDSVCVKDSANSTSKFIAKYADIDYTYYKEERFLGTDISALELNMKYGSVYRISILGNKIDELTEFIDYAIGLYKEDEKLEW